MTPSSSPASRRIAVSGSSSSRSPAAVSIYMPSAWSFTYTKTGTAATTARCDARRRTAESSRRCRGRRSLDVVSTTGRQSSDSRTSCAAARATRRTSPRRRERRSADCAEARDRPGRDRSGHAGRGRRRPLSPQLNPAMACGWYGFSSNSISSALSWTPAAAMASARWCGLVAPTIGAVMPGFASAHAMAT